jgi:D-sedoheptulose 7-phosphate isomerase
VADDRRAFVVRALKAAAAAHERRAAGDVESIVHGAEAIARALGAGGKVLVFGNGGSAADAQHFAAELVGRYERERRGLAAVALTTDTSILTAVGNDYGYERVFARQIAALGRQGDVALAISTSGNSPNVVAGLRAACEAGLVTVALTGRGGAAAKLAAIHIGVDEDRTARIQEVHATVLHILCELVERDLGR